MFCDNQIWVGQSGEKRCCIQLEMANRHGLIAGATGTGKTITLKGMAESFSDAGVPVFLSDVKGDLAGMLKPGEETDDMKRRMERFGLAEAGFSLHAYPTEFWDLNGKRGLPLRTTVSEFGPLLLARLLELNKIQSDLLDIVFRIADEEKLLLLDIKDLKAMLGFVEDHAAEYRPEYGNIGKASIGAIMRALTSLEGRGGELFFGEPALDIRDWFRTDENGRGMINILDATALFSDPAIYSTFMLWLLTELFEKMPEVGDPEKPRIVFFFDEAHLLFDSAPRYLLQKIEQVMKLIRSKGIGVFFVTQNPADIPDEVLSQLGNKVQHALRAYTPAEQKGVKAAALSFRKNPEFDTVKAVTELRTGEAVVSFLQKDGSPSEAERAAILPPQSKMGALDDLTRQASILSSSLRDKYAEITDRESAYEILLRKAAGEKALEREAEQDAAEEKARARQEALDRKAAEKEAAAARKAAEKEAAAAEREKQREAAKRKRTLQSIGGAAAGSVGREIGNSIGKAAGGTFGKRIGGNVGASLGRGILKTLLGL